MVVIIIAGGVFAAVKLTPASEESKLTEPKKVDELESQDKFVIRIDKYSIEPQEIKFNAKTLYTIDARKDVNATCTALRNEDLDLQIDIFNSREFPIRFDSPGTYEMHCIDSSLTFNIKVE